MNLDERSVNGGVQELLLDTVELLDIDQWCQDNSDDTW